MHESESDEDMETAICWESCCGYWLADRHLDVLVSSAAILGHVCDREAIRRQLEQLAADLPEQPHRIGLQLTPLGDIRLSAAAFQEDRTPLQVAPALEPLDIDDLRLRHPTVFRRRFLAGLPLPAGADEILLWNNRGEVIGGRTGHLIVEREGRQYTPALASGAVSGAYRSQLLAEGERLTEKVLLLEDVLNAEQLYLVDSLSGWIPVTLT